MGGRAAFVLAVAILVSACGGSSASPSPSPQTQPPATDAPAQSAGPSAAAESPAASGLPAGTIYVVRKGDTLIGIAKKFHITLKALRAANPQITDPTKIRTGTKITIPSS